MGSGASSVQSSQTSALNQQQAPTFTQTVETTTFIDDNAPPHTRFSQGAHRNSYGVAGNGISYGIPQGNSRSHNGSFYSSPLNEFDEEVEVAVAPFASPRNQKNTQHKPRRRQQQSLALLPISDQRIDENFTNGDVYDRAAGTSSRASDDLMFEVYYTDDGKEFMVLNDNGIRYYLDSWATGKNLLCTSQMKPPWVLKKI